MPRRRRSPREKDLTSRYLSGGMDEDRIDKSHRFTDRNKNAEQNKIERTAQLRSDAATDAAADSALLTGQIRQVFSRFLELRTPTGATYLATIRKTLNKLMDTQIVVGDEVRFSPTGKLHDSGVPEATIDQLLPRRSLLTRADSFKAISQHPIVANAGQMLIVAAVLQPRVKWGLIDRMIVAALAGNLRPILCLNKIDLAEADPDGSALADARAALVHYATMDVTTLETAVPTNHHLDRLAELLHNQTTVLAGHSGVGKSSLIRAIEPALDLRIAEVSLQTEKGRHTTTSARSYDLTTGGTVIDTPGVKLFGLWNVTPDNLEEFFPDVANESAPDWRTESYQRIAESLTVTRTSRPR